jgi:hypothetical protein
MSDVILSQEQYQALVFLARKGTTTVDAKRVLESFLRDIEKSNNVNRYLLKVRWQELNAPLPTTTSFPTVWPPSNELDLERTDRPIAKADVLAAVLAKASKPENILVTRDVAGIAGWQKVDDFFI